MNTINHTEALAFINSVEHVAHRCVTDELEVQREMRLED